MQWIHKGGLSISPFTLGTVQLGLPYGISNKTGRPEKEASEAILSEAWAGGIRTFDTAAAYGASEQVLGAYFQGNREALIVTKYHLAPGSGLNDRQLKADIRSCTERSLRNLRLDHIPILLLHSTELLVSHGDAVSEAFADLVRDGLIGKAGISFKDTSEEELTRVGAYLSSNLYEAVQVPINVFDQRILQNGMLEMMREKRKIVFARSVFLQGLFYLNDAEVPPHLTDAIEPLRTLRRLSQQYGVPLPQMAVSFVRDLPGINSVVIGAEKAEQVRANMALIEGPPLPSALRDELLRHYARMPDHLIIPRLWESLKSNRHS